MRTAEVIRNTAETQIRVRLNLDGTGQRNLVTGVPFLDHMLDQLARHGLVDLDIEAQGDLHIDAHHTVEDIGTGLVQGCGQRRQIVVEIACRGGGDQRDACHRSNLPIERQIPTAERTRAARFAIEALALASSRDFWE